MAFSARGKKAAKKRAAGGKKRGFTPKAKAGARISKKELARRAAQAAADFERRSKASLKGWESRRLKEEIQGKRRRVNAMASMLEADAEKIERAEGKRKKRKKKPLPQRAPAIPGLLTPVEERIRELERRNAELDAREAELRAKAEELEERARDLAAPPIADRENYTWVTDDHGWIRQDGTRGQQFSRLRTLTLEEQHGILIRMGDAQSNGHLTQTALELAQEWDCPLREVFTLFISP